MNTPRSQLLTIKQNRSQLENMDRPTVFSTTYIRQYNLIVDIIKKHMPILLADEKMGEVLCTPVQYVAKRASTIVNRVSPSVFPKMKQQSATSWLTVMGFHKCGHKICKSCKYAQIGTTFNSFSQPKNPAYSMRSFMNCNTKNTVYTIYCEACKRQYIGCSSTELKIRIRRHLSDIENLTAVNISAASRHFTEVHNRDTSHFRFMAIERVTPNHRGGDLKKKLLIREAFWIFTLGTRVPQGLNIQQDLRYQY